jgi:glycosyltransferase involved in cell wall biosynthesis
MKEGYIEQSKRKKILLLSDDIRFTSGIATMAREIVVGTSHQFNWVNLGGAVNHPEKGKRLDISADTNMHNEINDASVFIYPTDGYGDAQTIRQLIEVEQPDALMFFTDPRYWIWLFQIENEIRRKIPMIYLNIWDDYPAPMYNESYYESCDGLMSISKQTLNINKLVLGEKIQDKILSYVPHGINNKLFYPIEYNDPKLTEVRKNFFQGREYDFVLMFNSRNIRRKSVPDTLAAFKLFLDSLPKEKANKCAFVLHTQPIDEHGTDLYAVRDMLFTDDECSQIYFSDQRMSASDVNLIYNLSDAVILLSSNEGWGLSLTEAMMCGKPIIANVTGGMQDQMRFENEKGEWIDFDKNFCSNHFGTYKKHGKWAFPVFPSNSSLQGSVPTPYIYDDRADFREAAKQILEVYALKTNQVDEFGSHTRGFETYEEVSKAAYEWVNSDESMMTADNMCKNVISHVNEVLATWKPKPKFELIKTEQIKRKHIRHKLVY